MRQNTATAIGLASIFLGPGIAAAGGPSDDAVIAMASFGFCVALGLVTRLDGPSD